jgi:nucleoside triphosphate diphosphatase
VAGEKLCKLVDLMAHLRGPEGCPWDRAQDYDSMKGLMLEEVYEVVDAVNTRDFAELEQELGDLLFQVVFYARLAEEEGRFSIDDVVEAVHSKLLRRHPHVFGETRASTSDEALQSWLSVKEKELAARTGPAGGEPQPSLLEGIPASLPASLEAYELGVRAAEVGFDWRRVEELLDKVEEELQELRKLLPVRPGNNLRDAEEEVGDLMFTVANLARYLRSDPESCLRRANRKFQGRFQAMEREVARRGKRVRDCSADELDTIWESVKKG